jgi:hypothetical protein
MNVKNIIQDEPMTPIVARFSTIRYDEPETDKKAPMYASIPLISFDDTTHPTTYSSTTSSGKDKDKDDKGRD